MSVVVLFNREILLLVLLKVQDVVEWVLLRALVCVKYPLYKEEVVVVSEETLSSEYALLYAVYVLTDEVDRSLSVTEELLSLLPCDRMQHSQLIKNFVIQTRELQFFQ